MSKSKNTLVTSKGKFYFNITNPELSNNSYRKMLVDGQEPVESSFKKNWYVSDNKPTEITIITKHNEYTDWTIKEEYSNLNLPATMESFESDDDGYYPPESSFYNHNSVEREEREQIKIEWDDEIDGDVEPEASFTGVIKPGYKEMVVSIQPISSLVDTFNNPEILLPSKSCALDGNQMYSIIRQYIKENIDVKYAEISSDFSFCFTVKKKLAITPEVHTYDAKIGRQKKPRYRSYTVTDRSITVFEMTPPSEIYRGYTPMKGVTAKNHSELKSKVNKMLKELINVINEPLKSCPMCGGTGVIEPDKATLENKDV